MSLIQKGEGTQNRRRGDGWPNRVSKPQGAFITQWESAEGILSLGGNKPAKVKARTVPPAEWQG